MFWWGFGYLLAQTGVTVPDPPGQPPQCGRRDWASPGPVLPADSAPSVGQVCTVPAALPGGQPPGHHLGCAWGVGCSGSNPLMLGTSPGHQPPLGRTLPDPRWGRRLLLSSGEVLLSQRMGFTIPPSSQLFEAPLSSISKEPEVGRDWAYPPLPPSRASTIFKENCSGLLLPAGTGELCLAQTLSSREEEDGAK